MNNEKERAIDMMRHIAAAFNMGAEEVAGIFGTTTERERVAAGATHKLPDPVKAFMRDVIGVPEEVLERATVKPVPGLGFEIKLPEPIAVKNGCAESSDGETTERVDQTRKEKDAAALRVDMQETIDFARERFKRNPAGGFSPEAFSTLMMAYRSAIELAGWEDED